MLRTAFSSHCHVPSDSSVHTRTIFEDMDTDLTILHGQFRVCPNSLPWCQITTCTKVSYTHLGISGPTCVDAEI